LLVSCAAAGAPHNANVAKSNIAEARRAIGRMVHEMGTPEQVVKLSSAPCSDLQANAETTSLAGAERARRRPVSAFGHRSRC